MLSMILSGLIERGTKGGFYIRVTIRGIMGGSISWVTIRGYYSISWEWEAWRQGRRTGCPRAPSKLPSSNEGGEFPKNKRVP